MTNEDENQRFLKTLNAVGIDQSDLKAAKVDEEALQHTKKVRGYMARALAQTTLPHSKMKGSEFSRISGPLTLSILTPSNIGLPYGTIPRLLIAYVASEAVKTMDRKIYLGRCFSDFMSKIGYTPTGGKQGTIRRFKDQAHRLFSSTISCSYVDEEKKINAETGLRIADKHFFWWNEKSPNQTSFFESYVTLTESFFNEITNNPVLIDFEVMKRFKNSAMGLDIYYWLQYIKQYIRSVDTFTWPLIQSQFGANFSRTQDFKVHFTKQLGKILDYVPDLDAEITAKNIQISPKKQLLGKGVDFD